MNRRLVSLAVLVGAVLVGCGGTEVEPSGEPLDSVSAALVTCTASCEYGGSVSCSGSTCSATQGSGVTCDGVTTACAPAPTCTEYFSCDLYRNDPCEGRVRIPCCAADGSRQGSCSCLQGRLVCLP